MSDFFAAVGLVLVIEGLLFAAFPAGAKKSCANILTTPDGALRTLGLFSAVVGIVVVWFVRG